jgi:hypothetical protein
MAPTASSEREGLAEDPRKEPIVAKTGDDTSSGPDSLKELGRQAEAVRNAEDASHPGVRDVVMQDA